MWWCIVVFWGGGVCCVGSYIQDHEINFQEAGFCSKFSTEAGNYCMHVCIYTHIYERVCACV